MEIPPDIIERILNFPTPVLIGISGFGGSGKTTLAEQLSVQLNAGVVGVDSFMSDRNREDYSRWEIMDFARLEKEVLIPFIRGENPITYDHFDWGTNDIVETREIEHNGFLIIEGVGLFRPELLKYFSFKIWIDVPLEEANARGKRRDREVHLNPQDHNWEGIWKRNEIEYFEDFKPREIADEIISN